MIVLALILSIFTLFTESRKGPLPLEFWRQIKNKEFPAEKIVGGTEVDISQRPFQVVFEWYGGIICGGAWIGGKKVLTAAHCCDGANSLSVSIRAGTSQHDSGGTVYGVEKLVIHPDYDQFKISSDVCVAILEEEIKDPK